MNLNIDAITAYPAYIPVDLTFGPLQSKTALSCAVVEITTADGAVGHGFTAITDEEVIVGIVRDLVAPNLLGMNALDRERIAERLYWLMTPRGQTGYASHVASAVDLALWDILGKVTGQPCWRLLGGARSEVPLYVTFGFGSLDRDQLGEAARHLKTDGVTRFKMVVGHHGLQRRNEGADIRSILREDVERVRVVREAIGEDCELYVDANCSLDASSARTLCDRLAEFDISFFEEPVRDNDAGRLQDLRRQTGMRLAAGQNEGHLSRFATLIDSGAVDVIQPNAVICGGFTAASKVAALAQARNVEMANGGAFPFHNMHLHAGLAHGGLVEWHLISVEMCKALYSDLPERRGSTLALPETPGLGFVARPDALRDFAARGGSRGVGKG
ncbi:mandelate racemase/muconate lactonizing enzyme family protein [Aurantimonas sp. VKM B-3413]|uniref:mandelate racemase/muconate lactonizing enzyme family protein n=1 Tax=Aurantimonas sp. VKM B-3413 TaxID=2779401 RepID=UPI001E375156|nr:mandelate racemase/muconate lactonizing enzyme family protein [Aurantimonas sp. VKM B-3413]MCB8840537.1 mandelate racemase/muconate lactonizing enzyme family protein [Aurantimonas sp. VKM B-3413]